MKKLFIILLLPVIFSFDRGKEPPSKYYYKDGSNIRLLAFDDNDTAIYIRSEIHDIFDIKAESKKYQVFYDKKFTLLAVEIDVVVKGQLEYYKRYSRQGQLLLSYIKAHGKVVDTRNRYSYSGKIKSIEYFDVAGFPITDTTWNEIGNITSINITNTNHPHKTQLFYDNGKIKTETFHGSWRANTRFIIDYDSINGKQSYFLCRDTTTIEYTDQGEELSILHFRKTPFDSVMVIKKK